MARYFKPNNTQKATFLSKIKALTLWLEGEGKNYNAEQAMTGSVYFIVSGQRYRVSTHRMFMPYNGLISFYASPLRAPEIAEAILNGETLDRRGNVK